MSRLNRLAMLTVGVASVVLVAGCPPPDNGEPGASWEQSFSADDFGWVLSVAGRSSDAVYAVGGEPSSGAVRRYDGESWSDVSIPEGVELVSWVHCFESGRPVMAVFGGQVLWREGDGWRVDDVPTDQDLWGVWGPSPEDVWAVGGGDRPVIARYDGSSWSTVDVPDLAHDNVTSLFKVWGTDPENVFIVGENGTILHWNGNELRDQSPETRKDLISVWGSGPDRVAAVGGRGSGILARWNGSKWSVDSLRPMIGVNGVWVPDSETAWVAGGNGAVARVDLTSDEPDKSVTRLDTERTFHAIYGLEGTGLFAVGGNLGQPGGPYRGAAWFRSSVD